MSYDHRRHFRIKYPPEDRPTLEVDSLSFPVVDLSESGLKFVTSLKFKPALRQEIKGILNFIDYSQQAIDGKVVRLIGDFVMLNFRQPIPLNRLRLEADRLIARYGGVQQAKIHE